MGSSRVASDRVSSLEDPTSAQAGHPVAWVPGCRPLAGRVGASGARGEGTLEKYAEIGLGVGRVWGGGSGGGGGGIGSWGIVSGPLRACCHLSGAEGERRDGETRRKPSAGGRVQLAVTCRLASIVARCRGCSEAAAWLISGVPSDVQ